MASREAETFQAASARGRPATTAVRVAPKVGSGDVVAATGRVRVTSALPGMQTSSHMSHSAEALRVTLVPGARSAGGVSVTGKSVSFSKPLPVTVPVLSLMTWGAGHWMALAVQPGGRDHLISVTRPVPGLIQ